jgi:hypothetical protein
MTHVRQGRQRRRSPGLAGITGGTFSGELRYEAPTERSTYRWLTIEPREQCIGLKSLGSATPAQLARLQPGGDLYAEYGTGHDVVGGNICELGAETVNKRVYKTGVREATPGGWFLDPPGGGIFRIVNPAASWGMPAAATSRGQVELTGRKDDRTVPWLLEIDAGTATGSLYGDPDAPPRQTDTTVTALDPEGERVAELRAEQAARAEELRKELEAARGGGVVETMGNGNGATSDPSGAWATDGAGGAGELAGSGPALPLLALAGVALFLGMRK